MKRYNYKINEKVYMISLAICGLLVVLLSKKMINTSRIYKDYEEAKATYNRQEYIEAQKKYTDIHNQTKFSCFSKEIRDVLRAEEIVFIKNNSDFLARISKDFKRELENNEVVEMLGIYDAFNERTKSVKEESNENNLKSYELLVEKENLRPLFLNGFQDVWEQFQQEINDSIINQDFVEEQPFFVYSLVLNKIISDPEEAKNILGEEIHRYYAAKLNWMIARDDFESLLSEAENIIHNQRNMMQVEWVQDKVTQVTIQKMKQAIEDKNYIRYKSYGSRYFDYVSTLPSDLGDKSQVAQFVNDQFTSDWKKLEEYVSRNQFGDAMEIYDGMVVYMDMVSARDIDMNQLKAEIDAMWLRHDPIRLFEPLVLTEITKGQSRWGREAYVLAIDESSQQLYWGEVNAENVTKQFTLPMSWDKINKISISEELSINGNPVIMVEGIKEQQNVYSAYEVLDNHMTQILHMEVDSFEIKNQGKLLIGYDLAQSKLRYYEYNGDNYTHVFDLGDVEISNRNEYGNLLSGDSNLYPFYEVAYIYFNTEITNGDNDSLQGTLNVKYVDQYGITKEHSGSVGGYTWSIPINTTNVEEVERGLGSGEYNAYDPGRYTVEIWWNNVKLTESYFEIVE